MAYRAQKVQKVMVQPIVSSGLVYTLHGVCRISFAHVFCLVPTMLLYMLLFLTLQSEPHFQVFTKCKFMCGSRVCVLRRLL